MHEDVVYLLNEAEKSNIDKYKDLVKKDDLNDRELKDILLKYNHDLAMLNAKYMEIIAPLKAKSLRCGVSIEKVMFNFWKTFENKYEGEFDLEDLYIDIEEYCVKVAEECEECRQQDKQVNKSVNKYEEDDILKRLFSDSPNEL